MQRGWTIRRSTYFDSIELMRIAEAVRRLPGVVDAAAVMATPANRAMLAEAGSWPAEAADAAPDDLLVVVHGTDEEAVRLALGRVDELLAAPRAARSPERPDVAPRTVFAAARRAPAANLALIAVPGAWAAIDAHQALSAGLHVFLFSDGVALEDEIALKRRARARGLLVMGPECGTAIIGGVGLGFANRVRRGAIGIVGASGTGIQEVACVIHRLGGGISHAIGTGGRDLHAEVGGMTTLQALEWLGADAATRVIVIVSKPSSRGVADAVLAAAARTGKPAVACLLGYEGAAPRGVDVVATLEDAAVAAVRAGGGAAGPLDAPVATVRPAAPGAIVGLFTGGTLCEEARRLVGGGHRFVDFGGEEFTRGRPHPIIDPSRRHAAIVEAASEPGVAALLLDVVLGDGAHPDPAGALTPVIAEARERARRRGRELSIVAHVVGTDDDPQRLDAQEGRLQKLGVLVCPSNRSAALTALGLAGGRDGR